MNINKNPPHRVAARRGDTSGAAGGALMDASYIAESLDLKRNGNGWRGPCPGLRRQRQVAEIRDPR